MDEFTPSQIATRAGVNISALHFYEREGLISSERTDGNQRRYHRDVLRRIAFIKAAQHVGISLSEIRDALATLPQERTPTKRDWTRLSKSWVGLIDERMNQLTILRDTLDDCISCGCLSLQSCRLTNPDDQAAVDGPGARRFNQSR